jgi:FAD:protein FMN transferase
MKNRRTIIILTAILLSTFLLGCLFKREVLFSGDTMGTTYHVKVIAGLFQRTGFLKKQIENRLEDLNQSMSTFRPKSEISRFNAFNKVGEQFPVSTPFFQVMRIAKEVHALSDQAWDGTVMPLVNLWGFGPAASKKRVPSASEIKSQLSRTGFKHISLADEKALIKGKEDLQLDLASIAKGYGVDQLADLLQSQGFHDFLVEIGGEVFASGLRKDGRKWRVGINRPQPDAAATDVYQVVTLANAALATSGDYRNFFEMDGKRYTHVIDPRTGYPVSNGVVSVSVVADNCTVADGFATALMVLGVDKGLFLVNRLENIECLMVVLEKDGTLRDHRSKNFTPVE